MEYYHDWANQTVARPRQNNKISIPLSHAKYTSIHTAVHSYLVPNLDLVRVLSDIGVYGLFDQVAFAACNPQDQIVKRAAAQDIYVVAGARPAARAEAIRLVSHLYDLDRDLRWVVARHAPPAIAHVARRK
jgi:hypothetical protein